VVLEKGFLDHVRRAGLRLRQKLARLADQYPKVIEEVRGEGLMLGLKCRVPNADLVKACAGEHLLVIAAGENVVRLLPPLIVSDGDIDAAVARIEKAAARLQSSAH